MRREVTPELMDDPAVDPSELRRSLSYLRLVNRRFGGERALLRHLSRWSGAWGPGPVTLLDVGTGSADLPVAACRWAVSRGLDLRVTGVDIHEGTLSAAREYVASCADVAGRITLECVDAREIVDRFGAGSHDYAHAGLFLHHLPEIGVMTVLRAIDRVARRGIVWNDLVRSRAARVLIEPMLWGRPRIVRHDARVSVRAGFTRREVEAIGRRLDLGYARYCVESPLFYRFTFAGERAGAWSGA